MRRLYIHELPDWPHFYWNDAALVTPLASLRHHQGLLLGRMQALGFPTQADTLLESLADEIVASSSIEGETLSRVMVRSSVARRLGQESNSSSPSERRVEGLTEIAVDATQNFAAPVTAERMLAWHAAMFPTGRSGMSQIRTGAYRDDSGRPMQVVSGTFGREIVHFQAPDAERVPEEVERLLAWLEQASSLDPVLRAAIAHLWFLTIHPFDDGNGRLARVLTELLLARSEGSPFRYYSPSAQIRAERDSYYEILEEAQSGSLDITAWLLWFIQCLERAIQTSETTLQKVKRHGEFWQRARDQSLNERQRKVLALVLEGFEGKLTTSKWAKLGKCSQDTAHRDILGLVEAGLLLKEPEGGRSTSYSLAWRDPDALQGFPPPTRHSEG